MKIIEIDGVPIIIIRKSIKNMYLRVIPPEGIVRITAPNKISEEAVLSFAESKINWIKEQKRRIAEQIRPAERKYETGEIYYLWGEKYILKYCGFAAKNHVMTEGSNLLLYMKAESTTAQRAAVVEKWYRKQLSDAIPKVLEKCENITGVKANEWHIKNMRTKWGTCNIEKKRIWLNLNLVQKPPECLAYVITHELTHLYERYHNQRFYDYLDQFYPNWREIRQVLNGKIQEV